MEKKEKQEEKSKNELMRELFSTASQILEIQMKEQNEKEMLEKEKEQKEEDARRNSIVAKLDELLTAQRNCWWYPLVHLLSSDLREGLLAGRFCLRDTTLYDTAEAGTDGVVLFNEKEKKLGITNFGGKLPKNNVFFCKSIQVLAYQDFVGDEGWFSVPYWMEDGELIFGEKNLIGHFIPFASLSMQVFTDGGDNGTYKLEKPIVLRTQTNFVFRIDWPKHDLKDETPQKVKALLRGLMVYENF